MKRANFKNIQQTQDAIRRDSLHSAKRRETKTVRFVTATRNDRKQHSDGIKTFRLALYLEISQKIKQNTQIHMHHPTK